ncbi:hypothetical protein ACFQ14_07830 [Pseudahrensia aquimaris]|uniref:Uncharacterized protein n=1 Tax=Pseudahrensia aquimaris TaxID=744461 RepID=A0ABW3FCV0_9HYPH
MGVFRKIAAASAIIVFCTPSKAFADVKAPDGRVIECYCTDRYGQRRELGEIICITVSGRSYMAKCVMAQNNPFWRDQKRGCLSSQLEGPKKDDQAFTPFPQRLALDRTSAKICS